MHPQQRRDVPGDQTLAGGVRAGELGRGQASRGRRAAQLVGDLFGRGALGWRERVLAAVHGRQQRLEAVVEGVQPLQVMDDALIGAQGAGDERLRPRLIDFDQSPVTQRPVGRERLPGGFFQRGQRQPEGGMRPAGVVLGAGAQPSQARVQLHPRAQQQHLCLET